MALYIGSRPRVWKIIAEIPLLFCCLILTFIAFRLLTPGKTTTTCAKMLQEGRWSHKPVSEHLQPSWQPAGCKLHTYRNDDIRSCLQAQPLTVIGDSSARQIYRGIAGRIFTQNSSTVVEKHADMRVDQLGYALRYFWDPFLNRSVGLNGTIVISTGLWQARYLNGNLHDYRETVRAFINTHGNTSRVLALPVTIPVRDKLTDARKHTMDPDFLENMNDILSEFEASGQLIVAWYMQRMTLGLPVMFEQDGLHVKAHVASLQANILLNEECNGVLHGRTDALRGSCCTKERLEAAQILTLSAILGFCILSCVAAFFINSLEVKDRSAGTLMGSIPVRLFASTAIICAVILYCFLADRTPVLLKTNKIIDESMFAFLCLLLLGLGFITATRSTAIPARISSNEAVMIPFLTRLQTEEWKGWMQCVILLYHYFGLSQTLWIYRIVRVLVGSYLFLTGYGHTRYFLRTGDISLARTVTTLLRLNLLSSLLSHAMDTTWDFYYFPALASFWFLIICATLSRLPTDMKIYPGVVRILISATCITFASQHGSVIEVVIRQIHRAGGPNVNITELLFRLRTDLYAPFAGMLLGLVHTKHKDVALSQRLIVTERQASLLRSAMGLLAVLTLIGYFRFSSTFMTKQEYNNFHSYASPIPILAYVVLRNLTPSLRMFHSAAFAWLGRCSLETFVLQYHIWLAADTRGLLHIGILDRPANARGVTVSWQNWRYWAEKAILTVVFLWMSNKVNSAMNVLTTAMSKKKKDGSEKDRN